MKVSVLIPTHRRPGLLKKAIRSIRGQTHKDLEIVVYGDACGEETRRVIDYFKDSRIRYLSGDTTLGECKSRNLLVSEAAGDVICWQDDDDVSHEKRIELQLQALVGSKAPFCRCGSILLWPNTKYSITGKPSPQSSIKFVTPCTMTWARIAKKRPYHEIMFGCDVLWELETVLGDGQGVGVPEVLYFRNMVPQDRVTKVYRNFDDYDERMAWQREKREELMEQIKACGITNKLKTSEEGHEEKR